MQLCMSQQSALGASAAWRPLVGTHRQAVRVLAVNKQAIQTVAAERQHAQQQQEQQQHLDIVPQQQHLDIVPLQQQQQQPARGPLSVVQRGLAALPQPIQRGVGAVASALQPATQAVSGLLDKFDPRVRGLILLNAMTLLMGSNWVVIKESNDAFDPTTFTSLRFTLAAAAFAPFLIQGLKDKRVRDAGLEVGMWTALGYLAQSWALLLTPASRASLLSTFTVIAVPCLAGLTGERVKPLVWMCGLAALLGTTLLEQGSGEPPNVGDLLSILSALFFALQLFRTERTSRTLPQGSNLPYMAIILATVAAASCASAAAVHWQDAASALASLRHVWDASLDALGPSDSPISGAQPLFELFYTSFCSTDLVLLIELVALQTVSSTEAALIYSLEPVSGAAMAYAFLGERWGPMGWAGAAVILAASLACQLGGAFDEDDGSAGGSKGKEDAAQEA